MLKDRNSSAIVAVSDIARAKAFYQDTLGLTLEDKGTGDMAGMLGFRTGETYLTVYKSDYAGTNRANAVTWAMDGDLAETAAALRAKGVTFENYGDMDGMTYDDGVYSAGDTRLAWFKDPDGNILHLVEGM
jgi:catechol 2,3-dioxygenase-like lactoylglutathione lyase family enzyme